MAASSSTSRMAQQWPGGRPPVSDFSENVFIDLRVFGPKTEHTTAAEGSSQNKKGKEKEVVQEEGSENHKGKESEEVPIAMFKVEKASACHGSYVINRKLINQTWSGDGPLSFDLHDFKPEAIPLLIQFLYRFRLNDPEPTTNEQDILDAATNRVHLWCLGDYLGMPALQDQAIAHLDLFARGTKSVMVGLWRTQQKYIWENTQEGYKLREYMIQALLTTVNKSTASELRSGLDIGVLNEMIKQTTAHLGGKDWLPLKAYFLDNKSQRN
ncbi:hypothetical protein GLAREA_00236 [Glarea lozoyensis ATCC 20868]|uniref:BTB domain-containing protein n=2 Tax=Glarea lozoyensis TaxID=101852 RepID=S3DRH5_GLAL2|nr:uncharacterized protein GLAREA_00236 [Glarea lozoyensis ATCC 20868]EHL03236.1 hypothetical protein M7I_0671 [Glarea lozoyensis 74030]EPE29078.1 hypothetical protein GLAREA_00236 [Glarea lozoyensis ATCC 20868]